MKIKTATTSQSQLTHGELGSLHGLTDIAKSNIFNAPPGARIRRDWVDDERGRLDIYRCA